MLFRAVLSNPHHEEYGQVTIPFPIPGEEYDHVIELLKPLGIGDAVVQDCRTDEIQSDWPVLHQLEATCVNIDELDYLARRLDSFDLYEKAQFQSMAAKLELCDVAHLINLTFCCQEVTVITDFSDLECLGRRHFLGLNGGGAAADVAEKVDGLKLAEELIDYNIGYITYYGVVYPNGMELAEDYDGRHFPDFFYEDTLLVLEMTSKAEPPERVSRNWLYLPMPDSRIERSMLRAGINTVDDMRLRLCENELPTSINIALNIECEGLRDLNEMCKAIQPLSFEGRAKLSAVVEYAKSEYVGEIRHLAENLELFDFAPGVKNAEEYGRYMIRESGHFDYDENLENFYDYAKYGQARIDEESGTFTDGGYISYHGTLGIDELMRDAPAESQGFQMGDIREI